MNSLKPVMIVIELTLIKMANFVTNCTMKLLIFLIP